MNREELSGIVEDAVKKGLEEKQHHCVLGLTEKDSAAVSDFVSLIREKTPREWRDIVRVGETMTKTRNMAGSIFLFLVFSGGFGWMLKVLFPSWFVKGP